MSAFNLTQLIPNVGPEYAHVATFGIASAVLLVTGLRARAALGTGESSVVPSSRFSVRGLIELITEYIDGLCTSVIGEHGRKFTPFFAALFTFILFNNLIGLLPGMTPATENLNTTFAMGVFIFITYNFLGFKEAGLGYLKHFWGPFFGLGGLLVVLELISHLVRPMSLGLRLGFVLLGDHTVMGVAYSILPIGLPLPFYLLGLIVCFIQALVFTLLSMVYVGMATAQHH